MEVQGRRRRNEKKNGALNETLEQDDAQHLDGRLEELSDTGFVVSRVVSLSCSSREPALTREQKHAGKTAAQTRLHD